MRCTECKNALKIVAPRPELITECDFCGTTIVWGKEVPVCETHDELKKIPGWFDSLPCIGVTDLGDGEYLEMRNCGCGSTVCRFVDRAGATRAMADKERQEREGKK